MSNNIIYNENRAMQYVLAVDRCRNITLAAQELYISQPSLSKFIHNLEARLGFNLFTRIGGQLMPTREGEIFIAYARQICDIEHRMSNELTDMIYHNHGCLRLALPHLRSAHLLPKIIPEFLKNFPGVQLELYELHSQYLEKLLTDGKVDFAILNSELKSSDIYSELLISEEIVLVVPDDHPARQACVRTPGHRYPLIDIRLFENEAFILQPKEQRTRQIADSIFELANIAPPILFTTRNIETAVLNVAQGCGVCFAPESYIAHISTPRKPQLFSLGYPQAEVMLILAYFQGTHMPGYMLAFADILRKAIRDIYKEKE